MKWRKKIVALFFHLFFRLIVRGNFPFFNSFFKYEIKLFVLNQSMNIFLTGSKAHGFSLHFSWRNSLWYRNQSDDLHCKLIDCFLNHRDLCHKRVKEFEGIQKTVRNVELCKQRVSPVGAVWLRTEKMHEKDSVLGWTGTKMLIKLQNKLSLSNLKSANLNLACNQMQFRNHRLRGSLNALWASDCLSRTLEKHEKWEMKVCTWLLKELFHSYNQTYLRSFQQQISEILRSPWPFPGSRKTLMRWMCRAQHS